MFVIKHESDDVFINCSVRNKTDAKESHSIPVGYKPVYKIGMDVSFVTRDTGPTEQPQMMKGSIENVIVADLFYAEKMRRARTKGSLYEGRYNKKVLKGKVLSLDGDKAKVACQIESGFKIYVLALSDLKLVLKPNSIVFYEVEKIEDHSAKFGEWNSEPKFSKEIEELEGQIKKLEEERAKKGDVPSAVVDILIFLSIVIISILVLKG